MNKGREYFQWELCAHEWEQENKNENKRTWKAVQAFFAISFILSLFVNETKRWKRIKTKKLWRSEKTRWMLQNEEMALQKKKKRKRKEIHKNETLLGWTWKISKSFKPLQIIFPLSLTPYKFILFINMFNFISCQSSLERVPRTKVSWIWLLTASNRNV